MEIRKGYTLKYNLKKMVKNGKNKVKNEGK